MCEIDSFSNIRLEVERTDIDPRDKPWHCVYLLGNGGEVLASSPAGNSVEPFRGEKKYMDYIWGCVKPVQSRYDAIDWEIDPSSFSTSPQIGYTPIIADRRRIIDISSQLEYHRRILRYRLLNDEELTLIKKWKNNLKRIKRLYLPPRYELKPFK